METYWILGLTMAALSLWKVYLGAAIAAVLSFSYADMLLFNFIPAMASATKAWFLGDWFFQRYGSNKSTGFNATLRKMLRYWHKYGNWVGAVLAPVLLGMPSYSVIARRFKAPFNQTMLMLALTTWCWCSLIYVTLHFWDLSEWLNLQKYIDLPQ